ncbi:SurA N-terminal domain-containing protein [Candidatus Saccharibacteria bacterium]|nr:SurA N-terminal domain-containing protein [Candidatus Saccharibacteria bacterium]
MSSKLSRKKNDNKFKTRVTEKERVEARREEVLARGRKFKYPLQYAKHRLVVNTVIIGVVALVVLVVSGWAALYKFQDMGDIMYRISMVVPVPVAKIDGKKVKFSDYLLFARSSLTPLEKSSGIEDSAEDEAAMRNDYKRMALTQAEDLTFALKLGEENGIEVSNEEVKAVFDEHRKVGGTERSEESFLKVLNTNLGVSKREYERMLYLTLMKSKVVQEIDMNANKVVAEVEKTLKENGGDFQATAEKMGDKVRYEDTGGLVDSKNVDGGRAAKADSMNVGEVSGKFLSGNGDGYYFVKTTKKEDGKVAYASLYVKFTEFDKRLAQVREEGKVKEYIDLPEHNEQ